MSDLKQFRQFAEGELASKTFFIRKISIAEVASEGSPISIEFEISAYINGIFCYGRGNSQADALNRLLWHCKSEYERAKLAVEGFRLEEE